MFPSAAKEWTNYKVIEELAGLEILHAHYKRHSFVPHAHKGYAFGIIEDGLEIIDSDSGKNIQLTRGDIVSLNPGEIHTGRPGCENGWVYRMIYPSAEFVCGVAAEIGGRVSGVPCFSQCKISDPDLFNQFRAAHLSLLCPTSTKLESHAKLFHVISQLIIRHSECVPPLSERAPRFSMIDKVVEFITENYAEAISLNEISAVAGVGRFHLCRAFKRKIGVPPHAYQIQLRIERAKAMMMAGTPISQVSSMVGFYDQSHFNRHFKRIVGVSPGSFTKGAS